MKGLKTVLWICAICYLSGFVFAALPWKAIAACMQWCGYSPECPERLLVYMLRVGLAMCGVVGIFFVILARNPLQYGGMLPLAGYGSILTGLFCLVGGIRYALPCCMYGTDVVLSIVLGVLILIFRKKAMQTAA